MRPRACIAYNCNYEYKKEIRLKVFSFPATDDELLQKWVTNMKIEKDLKDIKSKPNDLYTGVCEQHFLKKCFYDHERGARLKAKAVPTLLQMEDEQTQKSWRRMAPDYEAVGESSDVQSSDVQIPSPTLRELRPRIHHDHSYLDAGEDQPLPPSPKVIRRKTKSTKDNTNTSPDKPGGSFTMKSEVLELKRQIHTQNIQIKRLEDRLKKKDQKKGDLEYAIEKLKSILNCCECGLKPSSEGELSKLLKRKRNDQGENGDEPNRAKAARTTNNVPTQVVCRNDLVVGLTWRQLFSRVNSLSTSGS